MFVAGAVTGLARTAAAATMYGTTGSGGNNFFAFIEIDLSTGQTNQIGDELNYWTCLDMSPDGQTLYAADEDLFTIDAASGSATDIGTLTFQGTAVTAEALSISPAGEIFVVTDSGQDPSGKARLYTVDPNSAAMTLKGDLDDTILINAIEFAADGTLYGAYGTLHVLDPSSGATLQTIGDLGDPFLIGLDIDENGRMVGLNDFFESLYTIDPAGTPGALATHLVDVQDELHAIASGPDRGFQVPEPDAILLLVIAFLIVLCQRLLFPTVKGAVATISTK